MSSPVEVNDYPNRSELIGTMAPLLKAARRPLAPEWERSGLDRDGWHNLHLLVDKLARHLYFEHLERQEIQGILQDAVVRYRAMTSSQRPSWRQFAAAALDSMTQEPLRKTLYLGVEQLRLPHGTVIGDARFLDPRRDPSLLASFTAMGDPAPSLVGEVEVSAGTPELLLGRARERVETALALVRQQNLFGFTAKIYLEQVLYRLDGTWTWRDDSGFTKAGRWPPNPRPIPMDLANPSQESWRDGLAQLSDLYMTVPLDIRAAVETCLDWLDVAALSDRWRIIIPAVFSGMEALLVPGTSGLKAAVVTVRSVAVHVSLDHSFFDPGAIIQAYQLRSNLIHGAATGDVPDKEAMDFAERRRRWAFQVLADYLQLARITGVASRSEMVSYLDKGKCDDVCSWLADNGGTRIVNEYRIAISESSSS